MSEDKHKRDMAETVASAVDAERKALHALEIAQENARIARYEETACLNRLRDCRKKLAKLIAESNVLGEEYEVVAAPPRGVPLND